MAVSRKRWRRRRGSKERRVSTVAVLPSLFTLGNAICGFAALYYAAMPESHSQQKLFVSPMALAGYLVLLAILADAIDGRLARLAKSATNFGGELDSLADVISFGVAPAFLLIMMVAGPQGAIMKVGPIGATWLGKGIWLIAAIYLCCTVLRLARFNVENATDVSSHLNFKGLPSPAAAGTIASLVVLHQEFLRPATGLGHWLASSWMQSTGDVLVRVLPAVTLALGLAMVSRMPYAHLVNQYVSGRRSFGHLVRVTMFFILCLVHVQIALVLMFCGFSLSGPVGALWRRWRLVRGSGLEQVAQLQEKTSDSPLGD